MDRMLWAREQLFGEAGGAIGFHLGENGSGRFSLEEA